MLNPRRKILRKTAAVLMCFIGVIAVVGFWYHDKQGNFHAITSGEAYRSAQLDRDKLEHYLREFNIRSVINLRGVNQGHPWYEEEIAVCQELNVSHYDLGLSAKRAPSERQVEEILKLFAAAPRPVLIHCQGGADRSGLAAAMWKMVVDGEPKMAAKKQLSIRYGHLPFGPVQVLDEFLDNWSVPSTCKIQNP